MKSLLIAIIACIVLISTIPLLWSSRVTIDYPKLTEEWYKSVFSIFQLTAAFFVFTLMFDRHKALERRRLARARLLHCSRLAAFVEPQLGLLRNYMTGNDSLWRSLDRDLSNDLRRFNISMRALGMFDFLQESITVSEVYTEYSSEVEELVGSLERRLREGPDFLFP